MKLFFLSLSLFLGLNQAYGQNFPKGKIIDTIICQKNTQHHYCLYLPSYYQATQKYPIIFGFDARARGKIPVEILQNAAEKYGYILVGSYNYRNGPLNFELVDILSADVVNRFSIDEKRIYTTGFSGGARFATEIAFLADNIRGVIACGAGFLSNLPANLPQKFEYIGLVGNEDMNYREMLENEQKFEQLQIPNRLIIFQAGHQWPSSIWMYEAIEWLELQALKNQLKPKNQPFIEYYFNKMQKQADSLTQNQQVWEAYHLYKQIARDFQDLVDLASIQEKYKELENQALFKKLKTENQQIREKEIRLSQIYLEAMDAQNWLSGDSLHSDKYPLYWWKTQYKELQEGHTSAEKLLTERMLSLIAGGNYERAIGDLEQKRYKIALKRYQIWQIMRAERAEPLYHQARVYALMGNKNKAFERLEKAIEMGFRELEYLQNDNAFENLRTHKKYKEFLSKLATH